eukprot:comp21982_c0_seq1/m.50349 comp21982_c0_seq1/g.50349  ORF comp21982_c0_seq1/g.50349 comp21982_c0_seq1/m.50349 type:complete len:428 (+) comp21982_c0_seq1:2009-3292(+)
MVRAGRAFAILLVGEEAIFARHAVAGGGVLFCAWRALAARFLCDSGFGTDLRDADVVVQDELDSAFVLVALRILLAVVCRGAWALFQTSDRSGPGKCVCGTQVASALSLESGKGVFGARLAQESARVSRNPACGARDAFFLLVAGPAGAFDFDELDFCAVLGARGLAVFLEFPDDGVNSRTQMYLIVDPGEPGAVEGSKVLVDAESKVVALAAVDAVAEAHESAAHEVEAELERAEKGARARGGQISAVEHILRDFPAAALRHAVVAVVVEKDTFATERIGPGLELERLKGHAAGERTGARGAFFAARGRSIEKSPFFTREMACAVRDVWEHHIFARGVAVRIIHRALVKVAVRVVADVVLETRTPCRTWKVHWWWQRAVFLGRRRHPSIHLFVDHAQKHLLVVLGIAHISHSRRRCTFGTCRTFGA